MSIFCDVHSHSRISQNSYPLLNGIWTYCSSLLIAHQPHLPCSSGSILGTAARVIHKWDGCLSSAQKPSPVRWLPQCLQWCEVPDLTYSPHTSCLASHPSLASLWLLPERAKSTSISRHLHWLFPLEKSLLTIRDAQASFYTFSGPYTNPPPCLWYLKYRPRVPCLPALPYLTLW